ncbi:Ig-like domain-containing protein [Robertkochia flava]|uniref:Ig-like domain-containing protein n=1 Tax=Robertkochia flava TaxID=3447986 RepID=UPI001CCB6281|nr:Ig-like domain-containing protein [Robertkochia marina]
MQTFYKALLLILLLFFACSKDDESTARQVGETSEAVDNTPPIVSFNIIGSSTENAANEEDTTTAIVGQQIEIEIAAEDAKGIAKVEAFVNLVKAGEDTEAPFKISIDFSEFTAKGIKLNKTQTKYNLKVSAYDLADNVSSVEQIVIVDSEMPVISQVTIKSDTLIKGAVNPVSFVATDNEQLVSVAALVDDLPIEITTDSLAYQFNIDTSVLPDGPHTLSISATDQVGLQAEHTVKFISDNTLPLSELTQLSSGSTPEDLTIVSISEDPSAIPVVAKFALLEISAEDNSGIKEVMAYMDSHLKVKDTVSPYELLIDLTGMHQKTISGNKSDTLSTLKVIVSDLAGNMDSISQQVYVDNIKPVISALTLKNKKGLTGMENPVYFEVSDNHLLDSVAIQIDGTFKEFSRDSSGYRLNINTGELSEGWHTLTITAMDAARNVTVKNREFLTDNTGPELTTSGLFNDQVIDSLVPINILAIDHTALTDSIKISANNTLLYSVKDESLLVDFNPELSNAGQAELIIEASDTLGNITTQTYFATIKRKLITIRVPAGFPGFFSEDRVFISDETGALVAESELAPNKEVRLHAPGEFAPNQKFILTFYRKGSSSPNSQANLFSLYDLDRQNLNYINLRLHPQTSAWESNSYPIEGFDITDKIVSKASVHSGVVSNNSFQIGTSSYSDISIPEPDFAYVYMHNRVTNDYLISTLSRPLPTSDTLLKTEFSGDNIDRIPITFNNISEPFGIRLKGFTSEEAFIKDQYHQLFYGDVIQGNMPFLNGLHQYRTEVYTSTYYYIHESLPFSEYNKPDWGVDFVQAGNNIQLSISGSGHDTGRALFMHPQGDPVMYNWFVRFNSQTRTTFQLPQLPESVSGTPFYELSQSQQLIMRELAVTKYSDLNGYSGYLQKIIRHNHNDHYLVSRRAESVFKVINNWKPLLWTIERPFY